MRASQKASQRNGLKQKILLLAWVTFLGALCAFMPASTTAQDPILPVRVEEDWYLEIIEPDYDETSPQITNTISPSTHLNCKFGLFEINHGTQPDYRDGGLELVIWDGDDRVNYRRHPNTNRLSYRNEVVRYTVAMSIVTYDDSETQDEIRRLRFEIKQGTSQTWGTFGNESNLRCSISTTRTDLSGYSPAFSVNNSKIGYASFRVRKYALKAVRYYDTNGQLIRTDNTERIAHEYNNNVTISE